MLTTIYLIAIAAEAMSGALAAGRRNMDVFGVSVIAFLTALGGGTIRDVVLGRYPIGWTQHPEYVYLVLAFGMLTVVVSRYMHHLKRTFLVLDALGLIAFSLIGCGVASDMNYPVIVSIMAGMITGIFGGVIRDVLCGQVPIVFKREIYASISFAICAMFLAMQAAGVSESASMVVCFVIGLVARLLAIWRGWRLPVFSYQGRWD